VFVHQGIGAADLLRQLTMARHVHDAQADGERINAPGIPIVSANQVREAFANQEFSHFARVGKQHTEFIAAKPPDNVGLTKALSQQTSNLLQSVIALAMAEVVVDVFKIIHVHENQCGAHALART
jgi:hypothetical protein